MARKNVEAMQFHVPPGAREKIKTFSESQGYKVYADYIRALIQADMQNHGVTIDLDVMRGQYPRE